MMKNKTFVVSLILIGLLLLGFRFVIDVSAYTNSETESIYGEGCYQEAGGPDNAIVQNDQYATLYLSARNDEEAWYIDEFDTLETLEGNPIIDGILVEIDCYSSNSQSLDVKISVDSCNSWSNTKNTGALPSSDTDTYQQLGSSSDLWGLSSLNKNSFNDAEIYCKCKDYTGTLYIDHIRMTVYWSYSVPNQPLGYGGSTYIIITNNDYYCHSATANWGVCEPEQDSIMVRYAYDDYPDSITDGYYFINKSCDAGTSHYKNLSDYPEQHWVFFSAWAYNETYGTWSPAYTNGIYYTQWNCTDCCNTNITLHENIMYVSGSHEYIYDCDTGFDVWANYSSNIVLYENLINVTGTHEYIWNNDWFVWANYTGNTTECPASCTLKYLNFSDENITVNITYWGCNNTNTSDYEINEDNWFNLAGTLLFDNGQFSIFISLSLMFFFFQIGYKSKKRSGGAFMLLSGFILIGLEFLITEYISALYVAPLVTPYAIFMIFLGVRKWLYPPEREKVKSEGE